MPIRSGKSLFTKQVQGEQVAELNSLYEEHQKLQKKLYELDDECHQVQDKIDFYTDNAHLYDEDKAHDFKEAMYDLEDELLAAQAKRSSSDAIVPLRTLEDRIITLEVTMYGKAKLSLRNELHSLYAVHGRLEKKNNEIVEEVKKLETQIAEIEEWRSEYDPEQYKTAINSLKNNLLTEQQKMILKGWDRKLYKVDERIIQIEKELYGKPQLTLPELANPRNRK